MDYSAAFPAIELLAQKELVVHELGLVLVPMLVELFLRFLEDFFRDDLRDDVVEDVFAISGDSCVFLIPQQPGNGVCLPHLAFAKDALFVERGNDVFDLFIETDLREHVRMGTFEA